MKKTYRNMALAAVVVLSASSLLGCNSNVQIPDEVKVQQGNANHDQYPYNDGKELDYVGKSLDNIQTNTGKIILNEITDIDAYRKFNTLYGYENEPYYSTRTTALDLLTSYPTADENDMLNVAIFERDGSIENCPNYDDFLKFTEKAPIAAELVMRVFEKGNISYADACYNGSIDCAGISFEPTSNCTATVVIGKDLSAIDTRFSNILPILQGSLGTESSSYIGGQEVSVHYFGSILKFV